jgi:hypothetical protein
MEHTPKNILIRAVKRSNSNAGHETKANVKELMECMEFLGVAPRLQQLFQEEMIEDGK